MPQKCDQTFPLSTKTGDWALNHDAVGRVLTRNIVINIKAPTREIIGARGQVILTKIVFTDGLEHGGEVAISVYAGLKVSTDGRVIHPTVVISLNVCRRSSNGRTIRR